MKSAITTNGKAIVSSKGQVVIPRDIREKLGIHLGHELYFKIRIDGVIEVKLVGKSIDMFFARCKRFSEKSMSIKEMDDAIMQAVSEKEDRK
jgi:AbrB family looped-hinge helix DNA binding protein